MTTMGYDAEGQTTAHAYDTVGNQLTEQYPDHVEGTSPGRTGCGIVTHTYDGLHRNRDRIDQQDDTGIQLARGCRTSPTLRPA